ncbi:pentatricopeptide repeat-containing protein At2g38420, mitochondrial-like [Quercus lobata]|uniref:pentatricopeptide repeat-containing protein At2g38420, mitochondrial-like n=1 Tax=Quercus lobata TaxID=97700 RepID=UPI001247F6BD|nr:pentatricopeptide repeat-containing protein At2g38420, mitochondrial-like [Quercus lobata]
MGVENKMELVRQILKAARVLKTMKITSHSDLDQRNKPSVRKKLRKFQRSTRNCQIAFGALVQPILKLVIGFLLNSNDYCVYTFDEKVLNQMKVDGIKPDIVCYTMAFKGAIVEEDFGKADDTFDELLVLGLVPDVCTYNVYIYGLCKQNSMEAGIKVIGSMEGLGCKPNVITYNRLLDAFSKAGGLSMSRKLVMDMGNKGAEFNFWTYRIMLKGVEVGPCVA